MNLSKALRTNLSSVAQILADQGRRGDTMLAHITPEEAQMLQAAGGAGTVNPMTGLPEFYRGKTTYFGGAGEYKPQTFFNEDVPTYDYSGVNVGVSPVRGLGSVYTPELDTFMSRGFGPSRVEAPTIPSSMTIPSSIERAAAPAAQAPFSTVGIPQGQFITSPEPVPQGFAPMAPDISGGAPAQPQQPGLGRRILGGLNEADQFLKDNPMLARALGAAIPAGVGAVMSRRAQRQAESVERRLAALGDPQQQAGQALLAQTQAGQLSAPQEQRLQEFTAQQRQGLAARGLTGGTAAQQMELNVQRERNRLLSENLNTALQLLNIGDVAEANAIRAGLAANQQAQAAGAGFYTAAFQALGLMPTPQVVVAQPAQRPAA
jgi:hypothetical protein